MNVFKLSMAGVMLFASALSHFAHADESAKQQLKAKLASLISYQASFSQKVTDHENNLLQQATGKIVLQQPNKLLWELAAPNESTLLADGQNIWNIDPFLEQVVVYSADTALNDNPFLLLTQPNSEKWQDYQVSQQQNQFTIKPNTQGTSIQSLQLSFKGDQLVGLQSIDSQQQTSVLLFSDIQQNKPLGANTFIFTLPEGFDLDDQR
ncbi:outer membrane lipoprotein chaperone LolA [Paraglaciecola aestuariivivens]